MSFLKIISGLLLLLALGLGAQAKSIELTSPPQQTTLIELYTSEGCSSCPPADRWLSRFKHDARLWQQIIPVAFHVDYWNYLGWRDRFSDARYSQRQRRYQQHQYLDFVYTPGLMKNGREWRGWFNGQGLPAAKANEVGVLKAVFDNAAAVAITSASAEFVPIQSMHNTPLVLNVALLGFDQSTAVVAGENSGKELKHDFVVLDFQQYPQAPASNRYAWRLDGLPAKITPQTTGIALWVTAGNDPTPIQATGGWLQPSM